MKSSPGRVTQQHVELFIMQPSVANDAMSSIKIEIYESWSDIVLDFAKAHPSAPQPPPSDSITFHSNYHYANPAAPQKGQVLE
jgi:hypothetical protein